jgi:hypothetical protein
VKGRSHGPLRLTPNQRRHLEVSLGKILTEMEEYSHSLQRWPLPGDSQDRALVSLAELEGRIAQVAESLGLRPSALRPDPARRLGALSSHWWETILNCRSQVLRGYGQLDPEIASRLDPLVDSLAGALLSLSTLGGDEAIQGEKGEE